MSGDVYVLGINGSPRRYGGVAKLVRIALKAAEEEGARTKLVHLYDLDMKPCIGCVSDDIKACRHPCVIRDDFTEKLANEILEADALIIGTPIYWYAPSGAVKNLIDRMTSFENMIHHVGRSIVEGKVAAVIAVGNDTGAIQVIAWMMAVLNSMGFHIPPWALAYYHHREGEPLNDTQAVMDSINIGKIVVKAARLLKNAGGWYSPRVELERYKEYARKTAEEERARQLPERRKAMGLE
ncbi:NADPH-dependent FMN reductase [Pyrolobus fumarii 1A]|uniref:NADPH-dependent FMN reductase n=1 Tax=Pyrolobus fumarii (strain DSM 11204 / 1A) TaxID=694429 RepID=G0EF43_PYRF1|nr:flavodoxin family protein [Pyrolobus fumarii]AEM38940.1 NADPH-dependent FMN reductase [Pyrolobus fumarii 1A]